MNEYTNSMFILTDNGYNYWITTTLNVGKYYIQFVNNSDNITKIQYSFKKYDYQPLEISSFSEVDVLTHLHHNKNEFDIYSENEGFYLLSLDAYVRVFW